MIKVRLATAVLLACVPGRPASSQPAAPAPPQARWHLDGASDRCVLTRELQGAGGSATFILRTVPGSGRYDIILAGPAVRHDFGRRAGEARIELAPGGGFSAPAAGIALPGDLGNGVIVGPFPAGLFEEFGKASSLRLSDQEGREIGSWALPLASKAAEALVFCEVEKQVEWGADRAALEPGATPSRPTSDPTEWVSVRDFGLFQATTPTLFTIMFRALVDENGRIADCDVIEVAGNVPEVQHRWCAVAKRSGRYEPARDAGGKPVRSIAVHALNFRGNVEFR